jgi:hypothetical protein
LLPGLLEEWVEELLVLSEEKLVLTRTRASLVQHPSLR